jgi:hypothetical protein
MTGILAGIVYVLATVLTFFNNWEYEGAPPIVIALIMLVCLWVLARATVLWAWEALRTGRVPDWSLRAVVAWAAARCPECHREKHDIPEGADGLVIANHSGHHGRGFKVVLVVGILWLAVDAVGVWSTVIVARNLTAIFLATCLLVIPVEIVRQRMEARRHAAYVKRLREQHPVPGLSAVVGPTEPAGSYYDTEARVTRENDGGPAQ